MLRPCTQAFTYNTYLYLFYRHASNNDKMALEQIRLGHKTMRYEIELAGRSNPHGGGTSFQCQRCRPVVFRRRRRTPDRAADSRSSLQPPVVAAAVVGPAG